MGILSWVFVGLVAGVIAKLLMPGKDPGGIVIDMLSWNGMQLDESGSVLTVQSGATWKDVIAYLDARGRSVEVMQSNNSFTVGGSISVNCHGWQFDRPPIASTVQSFRLLLADGKHGNVKIYMDDATMLAQLGAIKAKVRKPVEASGKERIMVIATGRNQRQLSAMADHLVKKLKDKGLGPIPIEGAERGDWVLIDAGDVIVHLFRPEMRAHYNLEKMWDVTLPEPERLAAMGS